MRKSIDTYVKAIAHDNEKEIRENYTTPIEHKIEPYSLLKGGYCNDTLTYFADNVQIDVSGEFYVDRDHKLHHTHIFDDGVEMEIVVPYENF